jgi:hypothetical protein
MHAGMGSLVAVMVVLLVGVGLLADRFRAQQAGTESTLQKAVGRFSGATAAKKVKGLMYWLTDRCVDYLIEN